MPASCGLAGAVGFPLFTEWRNASSIVVCRASYPKTAARFVRKHSYVASQAVAASCAFDKSWAGIAPAAAGVYHDEPALIGQCVRWPFGRPPAGIRYLVQEPIRRLRSME
jgi:hypothetical protein